MIDRECWRKDILKKFSKHPVWLGVDCGEGWRVLICDLVDALDRTKAKYKIVQIKEKFGGLRFYVEHPGRKSAIRWDFQIPHGKRVTVKSLKGRVDGYEAFERLVEAAEAKSLSICEECGAPGKRRSGGWIRTLCAECYRKRGRAR